MELSNATLHHRILTVFVDRGHPPTKDELCEYFDRPEHDVAAALSKLADYHGVVLHPDSGEVWVAHPFAAAPTGFTVAAAERRWWGTCAWCSLGVVALVGGSGTISTQTAWTREPVKLQIEDRQLLPSNHVIHFPIPMRRAWDNVVYTCSMMLVFENPEAVAQWCLRFGKTQGDVRPVQQIWEMAQEWYGRHLDPDWRKWSVPEAAEIFRRHGLTGPIWDLSESSGRF